MKNYMLTTDFEWDDYRIYYYDDDRTMIEIVDDCLDAWKSNEWIEDYDFIVDEVSNDEATFYIKLNDDDNFNNKWKINELKHFEDFGEYPEFEEMFKIFFKVDEKHAWTDAREDAMVEFVNSMTDDDIEEFIDFCEHHRKWCYDNYDEVITLLKQHLEWK